MRSMSTRPYHLPLRPCGHPYGLPQRTSRGFSRHINHQPNADHPSVHKNTRGLAKSKSFPQKCWLQAMAFTDKRPQSTCGSNSGAEGFRTPPLMDREIQAPPQYGLLICRSTSLCRPTNTAIQLRITRDATRLNPSDVIFDSSLNSDRLPLRTECESLHRA